MILLFLKDPAYSDSQKYPDQHQNQVYDGEHSEVYEKVFQKTYGCVHVRFIAFPDRVAQMMREPEQVVYREKVDHGKNKVENKYQSPGKGHSSAAERYVPRHKENGKTENDHQCQKNETDNRKKA